ncbi:MAG: phosphoglucosamine mutase [Chthoniobacterales bacterium]|nr:phosphoglucosamine mutase [Chthoniobacterales bacterium]
MTRRYFGTDGIRGRAGEHPITAEFAEKLGRAAARVLAGGTDRPVIAIGRDTRASGPMLEDALAAGITAAGGDVRLLGVLPTPGVAALVVEDGFSAGAVISASHNPAGDNGIKFFAGDGFKLPDETEARIEAELETHGDAKTTGTISKAPDATDRYIAHTLHSLPSGFSLQGMKIAVDCANGAASATTPAALHRLGADAHVFHAAPDGLNINLGCGSTEAQEIGRLVKETGAQVGLAHDGDADRLLLCDESGDPLDGDELLAMAGLDLLHRNELPHATIVATVMSNLGLDEAIEEAGGRVVRTAVGDRYVLEAMRAGGFILGGEQSGHIIFSRHGTTGDGLVSALQIFRLMAQSGQPLSKLRKVLRKYPQAQRALAVRSKPPLEELPGVQSAILAAEAAIAPRGRVLVRYSGTEPKLRVLLEGRDAATLEHHADLIAGAVKQAIGA